MYVLCQAHGEGGKSPGNPSCRLATYQVSTFDEAKHNLNIIADTTEADFLGEKCRLKARLVYRASSGRCMLVASGC